MKPALFVFAGPNGSGKSTITNGVKQIFNITVPYINADDIAKVTNCTVMDAAIQATAMKKKYISLSESFAFETVLSSDINLDILRSAKEHGFFIYCFYVITKSYEINLSRVKSRVAMGGHDVPEEKIKSRYSKSLNNIKEVVKFCDIVNIYDNSELPFRIFKKRKDICYYDDTGLWTKAEIDSLVLIESQFRELN